MKLKEWSAQYEIGYKDHGWAYEKEVYIDKTKYVEAYNNLRKLDDFRVVKENGPFVYLFMKDEVINRRNK